MPPPAGPYSQVAAIGSLVATTGQVGVDPTTGVILTDDFTLQVRQAFANLKVALRAAACSIDDVLRVGVYLTSPANFQQMNSVYGEFFSAPFPARTTLYVGLPVGMLIEVDALAVRPEPLSALG